MSGGAVVVNEESSAGDGGLLAGLGPGSRVGGYRLEGQIGAGGMAVVFRAVDERLGRRVALKVLMPALAADAGFRQRFLRESRAAAAVDDPHIIPVHEAGETDGVLFIAMRFVPGGDVRSLLAQGGPLAPARAAAIISPAASALDAAHAAGLVHRDVKPANILVDVHPDRPDHVYLADFGLSKATLGSAGLTGSGQYLGTPDYMAPEQIEGQAVDGRADQYALACAAFELLCGDPPFRRDQGMAVLFAHLQHQPPSLAARRPGLPAAADAVFARALAKDPADRYPTCRHFADALRQALGVTAYHPGPGAIPAVGEPSAGHPATEIAGPPRQASRAAALSAGAAAASTMGPAPRGALPRARAASIASAPTGGRGRSGAEAGDGAQPAGRRYRTVLATLAGTGVLAAVTAVALVLTSSPGRTSSDSHIKSPGHTSPAGHAGPVVTGHLTATLAGPGGFGVEAVAFSPDGRSLAAGVFSGSTYLWDVVTGRLTATLADPSVDGSDVGSEVEAVAFSPDGRTLAAADPYGGTYLWDVATGRLIATLFDPGGFGVDAVAFSPDGRTLATGDFDGSTYLWNVATGRLIATLAGPSSSGVDAVAFSPDGRTLAADASGGSTYLWDVATGRLTATLSGPSGSGVDAVAFSPDGRTLAAGASGGSTYLWDVATGRLTATLSGPSGSGVDAVAFSPDGRTLATGNLGGSTYLWNVATRNLTATLADPASSGVDAVAFSPDGHTLAVGDLNGRTYLWKVS